MKRTLLGALALLMLLARFPVSRAVAETETETPGLSAACCALYEVSSGRLLYESNGDRKAYMASTTKVMTALVAVERGEPEALVPVPDGAVGTEGSSMYLARGEKMLLRDLLYGLMLVSGNDAAVTIATHIAGSVEEFARLMNEKAAELGCTGTHFVNPNGLPDENHYTTARDLARIGTAAMGNPAFREIVGASYYETASGDRPRTLKNKNKILWQYDGGNGVKTGYTRAAGKCLVFSAERNGMTLVGAVLNAPDMWNDACKLLDYGFGLVENRLLVEKARPIGQATVTNGEKNVLAVYPKEDILYPVRLDGSDRLSFRVELTPCLDAPVEAGDEAGSVTLLVNDEPVRTMPLVAGESAARADHSYYISKIAGAWTG